MKTCPPTWAGRGRRVWRVRLGGPAVAGEGDSLVQWPLLLILPTAALTTHSDHSRAASLTALLPVRLPAD